jgi:hypothetical protein
MDKMTEIILNYIGWAIWGGSLIYGLKFAREIRQSAIKGLPAPLWPTLIAAFSFVAFPILSALFSFNKLHLIWIIPSVWFLSFSVGVKHIPILSKVLIWPAYFYTKVILAGTGRSISSPSKKSPWGTGANAPPTVEDLEKFEQEDSPSFFDPFSTENNFIIIATITARYYMELKTKYSDRFPDETMLIAMAGMIDAIGYIHEGRIPPEELVRLATEAEDQNDPLLYFMVRFEALIFSADTPEMMNLDILQTCICETNTIADSIESVVTNYKPDPDTEAATRVYMTEPSFEYLRNAAGVK